MMKKNTINQVDNLNKSLVGYDSCKKEAQKIERRMAEKKINEFKIVGIKKNHRFYFSSQKE